MNIECVECGRMFRKRKDSEDEIMQDVCGKCIEAQLREQEFYDEW